MTADVDRIKDLIDCLRVRRVLQAYLDGELDQQRGADLVARHLEACRRCGLAADSIRALKNQVAGLRREPGAEQLARIEQVVEHLTQHPRER